MYKQGDKVGKAKGIRARGISPVVATAVLIMIAVVAALAFRQFINQSPLTLAPQDSYVMSLPNNKAMAVLALRANKPNVIVENVSIVDDKGDVVSASSIEGGSSNSGSSSGSSGGSGSSGNSTSNRIPLEQGRLTLISATFDNAQIGNYDFYVVKIKYTAAGQEGVLVEKIPYKG